MRLKYVERLGDIGRPMNRVPHRWPGKSTEHQVIDLRAQERENTVRVEDDEWFGMHAQGPRYPDLEDLFEGSDSPGEREKGV